MDDRRAANAVSTPRQAPSQAPRASAAGAATVAISRSLRDLAVSRIALLMSVAAFLGFLSARPTALPRASRVLATVLIASGLSARWSGARASPIPSRTFA